jgi:hypothetical protein
VHRDTPAAKIFVTKSEHDFRYSMVVSAWTKGLAWLGVVLLNLFFIYFSMLRGLQRGQDWQVMYLTACMVQFAVEVIFYETSECAIIHFVVPDLARNEIHSVKFLLHRAIESLWVDVPGSELLLNAPEYLFVSTQIANAFPSLLESMVVRSYFSWSPGELSKKWRISHFSISSPLSRWSWSRSRVRRFTVTALTTMIMQYLGAFSPTFQRVLIHSLQPLVLSGMYFVFDVLVRHPLYFIPFVVVFVFVMYRSLLDEYRRRSGEMEDASKVIHPISESLANEHQESFSSSVVAGTAGEGDGVGVGVGESKECELAFHSKGMIVSDQQEGAEESDGVRVGGEWTTDDHSHLNLFSSSSPSDSQSRSWFSSSALTVGARRDVDQRKPRGLSEDSAQYGSDISDNFSSLYDHQDEDLSGDSSHSLSLSEEDDDITNRGGQKSKMQGDSFEFSSSGSSSDGSVRVSAAESSLGGSSMLSSQHD